MKLNYDLIPEELKQELIEEACREGHLAQNIMHKVNLSNLHRLCREAYRFASQPIKKPVDMEALVDNLVCEFSQNSDFVGASKGFLRSIKNNRYNAAEWKYCRPLFGHWYSAKNFDDVDGLIKKLKDSGFDVDSDCSYNLYRPQHFSINGLQDDYCMPWEG